MAELGAGGGGICDSRCPSISSKFTPVCRSSKHRRHSCQQWPGWGSEASSKAPSGSSAQPTCRSVQLFLVLLLTWGWNWSTTNTSNEKPSNVLKACASRMLRPRSLCKKKASTTEPSQHLFRLAQAPTNSPAARATH